MMQRMWKCAQRGQAIATARSLIASNSISALTHSQHMIASRSVTSWSKSGERINPQGTDAPRARASGSSLSSSSSSASHAAASASSSRGGVQPEYDDEFTAADQKGIDDYTEEELNDALLGDIDFDKIVLKNMKFFGHHGVYAHETATGQPFEVDLELETDLSAAAETDDLTHTVNYEQIHDVVSKIMTGQPHKLLERVNLLIIDALLTMFPTIDTVNVTIRKPKVGLKGALDHAAVNMKRSRVTYTPLAQKQVAEAEDNSASTSSASPSASTSTRTLRTTAALKRSRSLSSDASSPAGGRQQQRRSQVHGDEDPEGEEGSPAQWEAQQKMFAEMDSRLAEAEKRAKAKKAARATGGAGAASTSAGPACATPSRSSTAMPPLKNFNQIRK